MTFDWQSTGRKYGEALPADAFADQWAITYHEGRGWVVVKNREPLPWKFWRSKAEAKAHAEGLILESLKND